MSLSIIFALGSMLCAGVNDFIFKKYVSKTRSKGVYLSLIGVVWALIFYAISLSSGGLKLDPNTVVYSIVCGFFSIAAQILLLESLHGIDASIGSTIYRLNFIVVIILAPIFLGELLTPLRFTGSLLAVGSVLFLSKNNARQKMHHSYKFSFLYLAVIASILRGLMGFFYKIALNHNIDVNTFLFINPLLWISGGLIHAAFFERDLSISKKSHLLWHLGFPCCRNSPIFAPGSKGGRDYYCSAPFSIKFHYHLCLVSLVTERKDDIFKGNWHTFCGWDNILLKSLTNLKSLVTKNPLCNQVFILV